MLEGGHHTSQVSIPGSKPVDTVSRDGGKELGSARIPVGSKLMALSHQSLQQRWPRGTGSHCVAPGWESGQSRRCLPPPYKRLTPREGWPPEG